MRAIVKTRKAEGFELQERPVPQPGPNDVVIKVKAAAICGSDLKFYQWIPWCERIVSQLPFVPGHECAGEVTAVGDAVEDISVGDRVAAETHVPCGTCWQCTHGRPHTCERMDLFGHTIDGGFAEFARIPKAAARVLPRAMPYEFGCLLEPMGIPYRAVQRAQVAGDTVVVVGCGPIGQFALAFARISRAEQIIGVDTNTTRLAIAQRMGATRVIDPEQEDVAAKVRALAGESGAAGAVIDASGCSAAMKQAFEYLRVGGRFVILGQTEGPLSLNPTADIVLKEAQIIGLFGREIWDTWEHTEHLLMSGVLDVAPIITHRFSLEQHAEAFRVAVSGEGCKVLFLPESSSGEQRHSW